jgi:uncharacterized BrkB/YihY/UPF0761 family membrane protein
VIQRFRDYGWEYLQDLNGFSYFRKAKEAMNEKDEALFCDEQSRNDMIMRVYRGRIVPLLLIFGLFIWLFISSERQVGVILLGIVLAIYLFVIGKFVVKFRKVLFSRKSKI